MTSDNDDKRPRLVSIDGERAPSEDQKKPDHLSAHQGDNDDAARMRLAELENEHRDLDTAIRTMEERMPYDRLTIQRMKKRKLALKDDIIRLHAKILPDIIA